MSAIVKRMPKLFVGNLPWTVSNKELKLHFSKFGHIEEANVIFDKNTGLSKGYAFLLFSTNDGCNNAINAKRQLLMLEGRSLKVEKASI
jgi:RNA recognition motif-containing protein